MSTAATRIDEDTKTLYVAFELGEKEWKLAMSVSLHGQPRLRTLRSRTTRRLLEILEKEREQLSADRIVSCYEAGRDGFWLDRFLHAHGIDNRIVDSASIEVRRRARRVKTDRLDAQKLLTMLHRESLGEKDLWSVVNVPCVADEDARSLQREYRTLVKERSRSSNRIKGLLASQGLVAPRIDGRFPTWLASARLWDRSPVPAGMRTRVEREFARWQFTHDQVLALEKERRDRTKDEPDRGLDKVATVSKSGPSRAWPHPPIKAASPNTNSESVEQAIDGCGVSLSRSLGAGSATNPTAPLRIGITNASRVAALGRARSESSLSRENSSSPCGATSRRAHSRREPY